MSYNELSFYNWYILFFADMIIKYLKIVQFQFMFPQSVKCVCASNIFLFDYYKCDKSQIML